MVEPRKAFEANKNFTKSIRAVTASFEYLNFELNELSINNLLLMSSLDRNTLNFIQEETNLKFWVLEYFYRNMCRFPKKEELPLFEIKEVEEIVNILTS